jgi:sulfhydrogenase subunit beta (sulfur reductase)
MSRRYLFNDFLPDFFEILAFFGQIHAPVVTDEGVTAFRPVHNLRETALDYRRTLIPPKKYLLPPEERLLVFSPDKGYLMSPAASGEIILFGIHPCDLAGITYLDRVFLATPGDPWYEQRRRSLTLVGISCDPDEYCFCNDDTFSSTEGCDLFMTRSGDGFELRCGTDKGNAILSRARDLLSERRLSATPRVRTFSPFPVDSCLSSFESSPLWQQFSDRCLSCGACSACCPTCYCYSIAEHGALDGTSAERRRHWDNCLFKAHGEVAGGVNFRPDRRDRFHYRFLHKYHGFGPLAGMTSCVGCGRCREVCPVEIDLTELFRESGRQPGAQQ